MRYVLASAVSVLLWLPPVLSVEQLQVILSKSHANIVVASLCVPYGGSGCPSDTFGGYTQCCSQTRQQAGTAPLGLCTGRDAEQVERAGTVGDGAEEGGGQDGGRGTSLIHVINLPHGTTLELSISEEYIHT